MRRLLQSFGTLTTLVLTTSAAHAESIQSQTTFTSLQDVVVKVFKLLIWFLPVIATIYLAISGYRYMIAQGNPDLVEKAKKSLTYAVVGVVVSYSAVLIIQLFARQLGFNTGFSL